ncbi:hypothetical protein HACA111877_08850 [Halomonas casei]
MAADGEATAGLSASMSLAVTDGSNDDMSRVRKLR